ncbi:MAG: sigma-70 family RNA polymerase sigma factor [Saprospirales bacterium]|nr:MAG: sigma-70 family RNA polymerase sigma factor [Saprospirales bacterium]
MDQKEIKDLIEQCTSGDRKAQERFFRQFGPYVKGVVRKYFKYQAQADDAFIKAMYKIITNLDSLEKTKSLFGWMRRIAVNESLMELRGEKNSADIEDVSKYETELETRQRQELDMDLVLEAIAQLPEGYRKVFNLYEIDGYKHREIAEKLGISINTSKSQLIMAKKRLRETLLEMGFREELENDENN